MKKIRSLAMTLAGTLWPALAWAHTEEGRAEGLLAGLHHPIPGLDHVVAMVSVGLWGAQLGAPSGGRRSGPPRSSSASSRSSTATPTARSCRRGRVASSTASAS